MKATGKVSKGKRGMDEFAAVLEVRGIFALRGHNTDIAHALPDLHFEVKRQETSQPYVWLEQAIRDARSRTPIVAHRKNRREWTVFLRLDDFLRIYLRNSRINVQIASQPDAQISIASDTATAGDSLLGE
jgi:hypothetical protein